jgi:hypothetical protein
MLKKYMRIQLLYVVGDGVSSHYTGTIGPKYIVHQDFGTPSTYKATLSIKQAIRASCFQTLMNTTGLFRRYSTSRCRCYRKL